MESLINLVRVEVNDVKIQDVNRASSVDHNPLDSGISNADRDYYGVIMLEVWLLVTSRSRRELVEPSTRATTTAQYAGRTRGLRGSMVCIISAKAWT
ncbi:hypothetical protein BHE74_00055150 [Ensete ventricosum]|nr:hypothetical protein BHE74_00055150 [Ensete ventricosum]